MFLLPFFRFFSDGGLKHTRAPAPTPEDTRAARDHLHTMQFPAEWETKARNQQSVISRPLSNSKAKVITEGELQSFSESVLTRHVTLNTDFVKSIGND
eukprot:2494886-Rhodomonas_salina.1